jgi:hypothetical protein
LPGFGSRQQDPWEFSVNGPKPGISVLKAEVSKTARLFFESNGFAVVLEQSKQIDGIVLNNYRMTKSF